MPSKGRLEKLPRDGCCHLRLAELNMEFCHPPTEYGQQIGASSWGPPWAVPIRRVCYIHELECGKYGVRRGKHGREGEWHTWEDEGAHGRGDTLMGNSLWGRR